MKKILSFALALLIVGSMVACKDKTPDEPENPNTPCTHEDANTDYKCDKCGADLEKPACTHEDANADNKCDKCGADLEKPACTHEDANTDNKCDKCGEELQQPACTHEDANTDYKCDKCGADLEKPADPEKPEIKFNEVNEKVYALVTVELRTEPAADAANVKGELRVFEVVTRVAVSEDGEWSKIRYEAAGLEGEYYVASNCLSLYNGTDEPGDDQPGDDKPGDDKPVTPPVSDPNEFVTITPEYVYVTTTSLNLRKAPSMQGEVVAQLSFGTKLERVAKNAAGWSVVIYNGNQYYLSSDYVTTDDVTGGTFTALDQPVNKTVTAYTLKIRKSPWMDPTDENVFGYLSRGDVVKCVAISPDGAWYRIEHTDGNYYYVGAKHLTGYTGTVTPGTPGDDTPTKPAVTFTQLAAPVVMYTINKTGGVRVYTSPDMLTTPATTLAASTAVYCTEISTDEVWYKVTLAGQPDTYYYILVADLQTGGK